MSDERYNGWTNYATWRVNLEILADYLDSLMQETPRYRATFATMSELADHLEEYVDSVLTNDGLADEGIALDYARSFVSDVDYEEIAEHYPELIESDDDDDESDDDD